MSSEIWNLNTLCRCCHADGYFTSLSLPHQAQNGKEYVYENMLKDTLGISISSPPLDASYSICNQCIKELVDASNFRKQVLACEEKFKVYCTNEQFLNGQDTIKVEIVKDDNDSDFDCDRNSEPAQDVKEEFSIEVDINHPIDVVKDEKEEEKVHKSEPGIESPKIKNTKNYKTSNTEKVHKSEPGIESPKSKNTKNIKKSNTEKVHKSEPGIESHKTKNTKNIKKTITDGVHARKLDRSLIIEVDTENGVQYSCKTCGGCYHTQKDINQHIYKQHTTPYKCESCSKQLKNRSSFLRHMRLHTDERFQCPHCEKRFIEKNMFKYHLNTHTKENKLICDVCQKEFKYKQTLRKHLQLHAGTLKKLLCDLCGKSFNDRTNLNIHISTVHEKLRPFICAVCSRKYSTKNHLRKHIKSSHSGNTHIQKYHCNICDYNISCPLSHKIHMMRHDNKFMCRFCKEIFGDKAKWSEHVRDMHSGNHPCHLCLKTFYSKHSLNRHVDSHNGIKRFECEICGTKFNQKVMLQKHTLRIHNPDYTYRKYGGPKTKCEICKRYFSNIDSHMESHTNRKYACDICGKTYPQTNALNRHKESKHFGKSFDCDICNKTYIQKAKLVTHKIKVHKIKIEQDSPNSKSA